MRTVIWSLLAIPAAQAQYIIDSLSFGHKDTGDSALRSLPGWKVSGEGHMPDLMSDRIVLTPPAPGNKRGALWTSDNLQHQEWVVDFEFRASGPERGSGKLQVWLTKAPVGLASIYTIGQFDGFALVVDQYGGRGGSIRGFLNDGTISYKDHHNIDTLAFGHCDYAYRNLGRFSHLQLKQTADRFQVDVDGKTCFSSDKIKLPSGYYFGISAASAEIPDSFEASKFIVSTTNSVAREDMPRAREIDEQTRQQQQPEQVQQQAPPPVERVPDTPAASIKSQEDQFADLHNRLQNLNHLVISVLHEVKQGQTQRERHDELMKRMMSVNDRVDALERMYQRVEQVVTTIQKDIEGKDYKEHLTNLQDTLKDTHASLMNSLPQHMSDIVSTSKPKMGLFIFVIIAFQVMLLGSYIVYRRRRDNAPKKYL